MSAGAVFKLIANDGKADRMIMATELLNQRIKDIMCMRAKQGFPDPTPTLVDIERTHILYVNAHFKPFAAIGYEYNKVRVNTGSPTLGGSTQFSIAQFGDFFADMVVNVSMPQVQASAGTVPAFPAFVGADDQVETAAAKVSATRDPVTGVYTRFTHEYVDASGNVLSVGDAAQNFVRYAEYPGQRLFRKVKFEVNGNPLDEYTAEAMLFHQKFRVAPHKLTGWKRLVGQEVAVEGVTPLAAVAGASTWSPVVTDLLDVNGNAAVGAPTSASMTARKVVSVVNGPQTPKLVQPALDLWIPLLFWFNCDSRLAVASVAIPYGQRYVTIDLEQQRRILFTAPGNLWLRLSVQQQTSADAGTQGLPTAIAVERVDTWTTYTPVLAAGSAIADLGTLNLELYVNNIFVNPEIHDIYIRRIGFSLIRVHRFQSQRVLESTNSILLSQLKWPIETMYVGLRPAQNVDPLNSNEYRDWHRLTLLTDQQLDCAAASQGEVMTDDTVAFNAASIKHKFFSSQTGQCPVTYPVATETIDTLELQAHGITIYADYKSAFYRDYLPYTFGGTNIVTPEDPGALMLNFCLYPGTYQPSGHMNVSRAREFYLDYVSSYVTQNTPADLLVLAKAINFLLISDGSAVLRYST